MAKTFKNLPVPALIAPAKKASERDFFDLTDDPQPARTPTEEPATGPDAIGSYAAELPGNTGTPGTTVLPSNPGSVRITDASREARKPTREAKPGNTDHTSNTDHKGTVRNNGKPGNTVSLADSDGTVAALSSGVRQTFVLNRAHLERLRDHVHARRAGGDYTYSQKQALQEALDLLFACAAPVETRPEQVRAREQAHRERIQQGRLPRT